MKEKKVTIWKDITRKGNVAYTIYVGNKVVECFFEGDPALKDWQDRAGVKYHGFVDWRGN